MLTATRKFHRRRNEMLRKISVAAGAALLSALCVPAAHAGFTEVNVNDHAEPEQAPILSHALGGSFTGTGNNFTNGTITATQLDDNSDQIWSQSIVSAQSVAAFSKDPEIFGYIAGTGQGSFVPLFTAGGNGYDVTGSSGAAATPGSYQLARSGTSTFSSNAANNPDGDFVHLLAYSITGLPNQTPDTRTWMLFWEDTVAQYSDWDYNDLAVKLVTDAPESIDTPPPVLIPLPPAFWSGMSGLIVLFIAYKVGRVRRQLA